MIEGKTKTGFEYQVNEKILTDYRYITAAARLTSKDYAERILAWDKVSALLLGDKVQDLITHIEELNDGFVPFDKMTIELNEIAEACVPKKSTTSQES